MNFTTGASLSITTEKSLVVPAAFSSEALSFALNDRVFVPLVRSEISNVINRMSSTAVFSERFSFPMITLDSGKSVNEPVRRLIPLSSFAFIRT